MEWLQEHLNSILFIASGFSALMVWLLSEAVERGWLGEDCEAKGEGRGTTSRPRKRERGGGGEHCD